MACSTGLTAGRRLACINHCQRFAYIDTQDQDNVRLAWIKIQQMTVLINSREEPTGEMRIHRLNQYAVAPTELHLTSAAQHWHAIMWAENINQS